MKQSWKIILFIAGILGLAPGWLMAELAKMYCTIGVNDALHYRPGDEARCDVSWMWRCVFSLVTCVLLVVTVFLLLVLFQKIKQCLKKG